jgi:pyruvate dehydrogenase E2 component (dihydrolipoamide acetyltransferase)
MPDVIMPRLSDTMTEGIIAQWLKAEGDDVRRGDTLAEIETDKATMELEAYASGVLTRILAQPGSTVPIGQPIAVIGEPDGADSADRADRAPADPAPVTPTVTSPAVTTPAVTTPAVTAASGPADPAPGPARRPAEAGPGLSLRSSPLARALARKHGLDLATVTGTGPGGRIVRADVEAAAAAGPAGPAATRPAGQPQPPAPAPAAATGPGAEDERIPLSSIRRITAQRLAESAAAPHFYLTSVVDVGALLALRAELNAQLAPSGPKISVTDLLIRACALTLREHPEVNSSWGGDHLLRHGRVNVGIAVALTDGLIVPVVPDADRKSITQVATEAHILGERARAGKLTPDQFSGGTFTISNLGMYGIDQFTAVINPPEAAILAVGTTREQPVLRDGQLVNVHRLKLTLTVDHGVLDGATAAAFLRDLVTLLERPLRIVV